MERRRSVPELFRCFLVGGHELGVVELCDVLQLPQSTVSRHLKVLGDQGWDMGEHVGAIPGVEAVGAINYLPLSGSNTATGTTTAVITPSTVKYAIAGQGPERAPRE